MEVKNSQPAKFTQETELQLRSRKGSGVWSTATSKDNKPTQRNPKRPHSSRRPNEPVFKEKEKTLSRGPTKPSTFDPGVETSNESEHNNHSGVHRRKERRQNGIHRDRRND